jgi:UDP-3-O-[3-hydroxymyristoyl] N-acetylglucosamine deacetylase/3-hydroxyacyl-[acyl-carrier-protein] dehydratase
MITPEFNRLKQHTIANPISISGAGLHSGISVNITLKPEPPDSGIRFQRTDLPGKPLIAADCDLVSDTFRCTTLTANGASISTVEHILAALTGSGIDNCLIEVNGKELPIMDGSCALFMKLIGRTGIEEQNAKKNWFELDTEITLVDLEKNVTMVAAPNPEYTISTYVDFKGDVLQPQHATLQRLGDFKMEISSCRTYCLVHELEMLLDQGLIQGDIVSNAILIVDKPVSEDEKTRLMKKFNIRDFSTSHGGYLNNQKLQFANEIARHKLMDIIGDLTLTGLPINAKILASRPGHATNVAFAKKIKQLVLQKTGDKLPAGPLVSL